jgi:hypothetical protein
LPRSHSNNISELPHLYEISQALNEQGMALSATAVREVLAPEGYSPQGWCVGFESRHRAQKITDAAAPAKPARQFALSCCIPPSSVRRTTRQIGARHFKSLG